MKLELCDLLLKWKKRIPKPNPMDRLIPFLDNQALLRLEFRIEKNDLNHWSSHDAFIYQHY